MNEDLEKLQDSVEWLHRKVENLEEAQPPAIDVDVRTLLAGLVMAGLLANSNESRPAESLMRSAIVAADLLLAELAKPREGP